MAEANDGPDNKETKTVESDVKIKEDDDITAKKWKSRVSIKPKSVENVKQIVALPEEELKTEVVGVVSNLQLADTTSRKSRKESRYEALRLATVLSTDFDFKNVGFETALTKEEKTQKKHDKIAEKKAAKAAKAAESGQAPSTKKEKKPKKAKSNTKAPQVTEDAPQVTEDKVAADDQTPGGTDQQKVDVVVVDKKKKGKKGKKTVVAPVEEEPEVPTVMDMLRKRASEVMDEIAMYKRQSLTLQGKLSFGGGKRKSIVSEKRRKSSQANREKSKNSLVQLHDDDIDAESSRLAEDHSVVNIIDDVGKGKKAKGKKKGTAVRESDKDGARRNTVGEVKKKHKTDDSKVLFDNRVLATSELSQESDGSYMSGSSDDDLRKNLKRRRKSKAKKPPQITSKTSAVEKAQESGRLLEDAMIRTSRTSRISKVSRVSRVSRVSKPARTASGNIDDEDEVTAPKRAVPPAVPLPKMVEDASSSPEDQSKKGRKGKKKGRVEEVAMEELSITEQIARMKAQADSVSKVEETPEVVEEEPLKKAPKKKGKKEKKMTKEQRSAYNAEKAEQERLAAEAEAAAIAEAERIRQNNERKMANDLAKKEQLEQNIRNEQLQSSLGHMLKYKVKQMAHEALVKQEEEWIEYLKCDGLPDPSHCADMNAYLHLWEKDIATVDMAEAERRTNEVLKLLDVLDLLIFSPYFDDSHKVNNWKWVRGLVRNYQSNNLDTATYRLLRNIAQNMQRLNIPTADFRLKSELFSLCIWLKVQLPIPIPNPRTPPPPRIKLKFPEMGLKVQFPATLVCEKMAIRAMYLKYDHLSDTCKTFDKPPTPDHYNTTILQEMQHEWYEKMMYKYKNRNKSKKKEITLEDGTTVWVEPDPEAELVPGQIPPAVPYKRLTPTAEEYILQLEEDVYHKCREDLIKTVPLSVLNMREYVILGGVFYLHLYYQPPQPQSMVTYDLTFTTLQRPLSLQEVFFHQIYIPSTTGTAGTRRTPEEIEEELKQQEAELDKLILVNLTMPQHVIWLDVPLVVHWDGRHKTWTKKYVHDFKHMEERNYLTFRTSIFGPFALATNKHASLPYQAWELKPETDGTVTLQITTALLMIEFNIKDSLVSMTQLQNSPNNALQDIVGRYYKLSTLKKMLVEGGVDIFPDADAFCYVPRTCEKHYPTEKHMYEQMAQLSGVFNFSWSRWNLPAGRRSIVCQMREYNPDKQRQKNHSMLMVTPLKTVFIDCTEVSPVFSEVPTTDESKMYADLYHLMRGQYKVAVRISVNNHPVDIVNTLADLLILTRVNSFS